MEEEKIEEVIEVTETTDEEVKELTEEPKEEVEVRDPADENICESCQ